MRARTNAPSRRIDASANGGGGVKQSIQEDDGADCNGKDKPVSNKFRRPPMASFKLPPPPKIALKTSISVPAVKDDSNKNGVAEVNADNGEKDDSAKPLSAPSLPPVQAVPIPLPQGAPSAVLYQRPLARNIQTSDIANTTTASTSGSNGVYNTDSINSYSTQQRHQYQPSSTIISHPYKPSSWYADAKKAKKSRQILNMLLGVVISIIILICLWLKREYIIHQLKIQLYSPPKKNKRQHKNYHHHEKHYHPMLGINEIPIDITKDERTDSPKKRSYRQLEQEHGTSNDQYAGESQAEQTDVYDLFSTFPVTTLSNKRLLPYVGFGVSSRSVEHKQIPIIVSTLLQYASSETEGGGGIAMIDAVIDEDRKLENDGGSLQYSISNKVAEKFEEDEEKLESNMAKTVVTLVGRAITFFGKEHIKLHKSSTAASNSGSVDDGTMYDYENRVEVHLLVGLSGPDLGAENTIEALRYFANELEGVVPPFPRDVLHTDLSTWKPPTSSTAVDHHVDVRLHVFLRLNHCHNRAHKVAPCSSDVETNKDLLERFIGSYTILEKLYEAKIIHGIGLDGIHSGDIQYLIKKCTIKPQLYRGDVSQALDVYGRRHGHQRIDKEEHIAKTLKENNITFLASNVAGHVLEMKAMTPNAYALLQNLGNVLFHAHLSQGHLTITGEGAYYSVPRLILSYLVRHKVCVLPHAYKAEHLADDSPESVGGLANFLSERRVAEIGAALKALLSENDLPEDHGLGMEGENEVAVVFHNHLEGDAHIFRVMQHIGDGKGEKEVAIPPERGGTVKSGDSVTIIANKGDKFVAAASADGDKRGTYIVTAEPGAAMDFTIPGLSEIDHK